MLRSGPGFGGALRSSGGILLVLPFFVAPSAASYHCSVSKPPVAVEAICCCDFSAIPEDAAASCRVDTRSTSILSGDTDAAPDEDVALVELGMLVP